MNRKVPAGHVIGVYLVRMLEALKRERDREREREREGVLLVRVLLGIVNYC